MPSQVGASHSPRRPWRRSASRSAPSGSAAWCRWAMARRSRGGSRRRAAANRTSSASAAVWWGGRGCRGRGRWHGPPTARRRTGPRPFPLGAAEQGPGGADRAGRGAGAQVEAVAEPAGGGGGLDALLGPGGAAAIHGGQVAQPLAFQAVQQPRSRRTCSARAASGCRSRSWAARSSTRASSAARLSGGLPGGRSHPSGERVFELMAASYQALTRTQAPTRNCEQLFSEA
jgi:hypothetical protein